MFRRFLVFLLVIFLAVLPVTPAFAAIVIATGSAIDISVNSATLTGTLASLDTHKSVEVWFEYGAGSSFGYTTPPQPHTNPGAISARVTGLNPGTTYHFRAVVLAPIPGASPVYGAAVTFATRTQPPPPPPPPPPSPLRVTTGAAHDITGNSAHLNGELNSSGNNSSVLVWFDWGTSTNYGNSTARQTHTAPGTFSLPLSGLQPGTTYHFRAAAVAPMPGAQPVYGVNMSFTTTSAPGLQVVTESVTGVTANSATLLGDLTSLGPSNAIVNVWFEWGTTTVYGNRTPNQSQTRPTVFNATITGLNAEVTYHYRAAAKEEVPGGATVFGADRVFTTAPAPSVQVVTGSASNITASSAYLNGDLTLLGSYKSVDVWFEWGTTTAYGTVTARQTYTGPGAFSVPVAGLYSGTTYHFRAVAQAPVPGAPVVYGADRSFTAAPTPTLSVVTEPASSVTANSAYLNGDLTSIGGYKAAEIWFEWGTTTAYGNVTPVQTHSYTSIFSAPVINLTSGVTYHFRAIARGDAPGAPLIYGYGRSFTATPTPGLIVTTVPANGITFNSAYLHGDLISLGTYAQVQVWLEWGQDISYGSTTTPQTYSGPIDYSAPLLGLNPGTLYHFRAVARASMAGASTVYGNDMVFTTNQTLSLTVLTEPATDITTASATLNGDLSSLGNYATVQVWFDWGTTTAYGNSTPPLTYPAVVEYSVPIVGLSTGATYHFRAVARAPVPGAPPAYGADMVFIANPIPNPMIVTEPADEITTTSAKLNGELNSLGGYNSVPVYFEWGTTTAYGSTTPAQIRADLTDFGANITGLTPGTGYYFRAVAIFEGKPVYGNGMAFNTRSDIPLPKLKVVAVSASGITANSVTLSGNLESLVGYSSVRVWFDWGKTTGYGNSTAAQMLTAPGAVSAHITGLTSGTTYHFRALAAGDGSAVVYSSDEVFTTAQGPALPDTTTLLAIVIGILTVVVIIILVVVTRRR